MTRLALFQHEPYCSRDCCAGIMSALSASYDITLIGMRDLNIDFLSNFDLLIFPGGRGEASQFHTLFRHHADSVRAYVKQGGRYLGICMGAFWADAHYFNLLNGLRCAQYITRPNTEIKRSYPTLARVNWQGQIQQMYFYDGCTVLGHRTDSRIIANYANGDPMALIQNNVGVIGCHPESEAHWYYTKSLKSAWHEYRHHHLLLDFVNQMMIPAFEHIDILSENTELDLSPIHSALNDIVKLTHPFTRGTHQKVNHIAHTALAHIKKISSTRQ